jgi:hypothetical protein
MANQPADDIQLSINNVKAKITGSINNLAIASVNEINGWRKAGGETWRWRNIEMKRRHVRNGAESRNGSY